MTDKKKHDDKDRQKVSDEELEDVAGGASGPSRTKPRRTKASPEVCDGKDDDCDGDPLK